MSCVLLFVAALTDGARRRADDTRARLSGATKRKQHLLSILPLAVAPVFLLTARQGTSVQLEISPAFGGAPVTREKRLHRRLQLPDRRVCVGLRGLEGGGVGTVSHRGG